PCVECYAEAARVVRRDGFVVVNIGGGYALRHTRARVATVRSILPHVVMTAEPGILRGRRFGNLVLVAGHRPLPAEELGRLAHRDSELARLVDGKDLERFSSGHSEVHDADAADSPAPPEHLFSRMASSGPTRP